MIDVQRWSPFLNLEDLHDRVNRLFQESMGRGTGESASARTWSPIVDIYEDQDGIVLQADLAGVKREDIEIEMTGDVLTISGERKFEQVDGRNYLRLERPYGPFRRSFNIGVPIGQAQIKASLKDGILEVRLPRAEETKPKKIQVEAT